MAYAGRQPTTGFRSTPTKDSFNGDNSTTEFTLSIATRTNDVEVFVENVQQEPVTAYSISGNTLTFTSAPPTGTNNIYVIHRAELVSNGVHTPGANLEGGATTLDSLTVTGATDIDTSLNVDGTVTADGLTVDGNVGIGTSSPSRQLEIYDDGTNGQAVLAITAQNTNASRIMFADPDDNNIGILDYNHSDNSMRFTANNAERMRIDSSGNLLVGTTNANIGTATSGEGIRLGFTGSEGCGQFVRAGGEALTLGRNNNDGVLVRFRQGGNTEGTISVSGTTVSYNGGHLARWSQLADNTRDESIVKGTVMSNLDQMAEWTHEGVTEDNEQLNCMKVSDVEGDADVAGVFVNWDDDDDFNDMNIAMTGDMVIRIAQGTTVARGDLLMSAGDGTAKPQGDDIVRSKTIAKVTSTHVSHTYDDGSYLVPCVLMAC